jgi:hypothetical protein
MSRAITATDTILSLASRTGEIVSETVIVLPSLRTRSVSSWSTVSPANTRRRISACSPLRSGDSIIETVRPIASSAV